jgi:hypothetical protein
MSKKKRTTNRLVGGNRPQNLVGKVIVGMYPRHNFQGIRSHCERRQVLVERVRILGREPLDPITSTLNPLQIRGKVLVTGTDLDKHEERSFYLDSFQVWESFDYVPDTNDAAEPSSRAATNAMAGMNRMAATKAIAGTKRPPSKRSDSPATPLRRRGA